MNVETVLFALLREELCGEIVGNEIKEVLSSQLLEELYKLSKKHSVAHIIGQALTKLGVLGQDELSVNFQKTAMDAVAYHIRMTHAFHSICNALEEEKLPFLPLKGSVLRQWYPEPWMRTSSDIDILVRPEDHAAAVNCLMDKCECQYMIQSNHDVSLRFPGRIHVEIHHTLIEDTVSVAQEKVLSGVWRTACLEDGSQYRYRMSDIMFRFYHYAHMTKHIKNGGCGIRPFMDLWIMNHRTEQDRTGEEKLFAQGDLSVFAAAAEKLSEVWFSGVEADSVSDMLARFVLEGGTAGTLKNRVSMKQVKKGGKLQYVLHRIFMPYENLKEYYPVLRKHKWLLPFYQFLRWCRILFKGRIGYSAKELALNANTTQEESAFIAHMIKELKL